MTKEVIVYKNKHLMLVRKNKNTYAMKIWLGERWSPGKSVDEDTAVVLNYLYGKAKKADEHVCSGGGFDYYEDWGWGS